MENDTQLSLTDRQRLYAFLSINVSKTKIAKRLNRRRSVIYHEIKRNSEEDHYLPVVAHRKAVVKKVYNHICI